MDDNFCNPMDALNIFSAYLSILNYNTNLQQSTNDDILKELKMQDDIYLQHSIEQNELIIKQNEEIINLLKKRNKDN